jgi:hypothetical protein
VDPTSNSCPCSHFDEGTSGQLPHLLAFPDLRASKASKDNADKRASRVIDEAVKNLKEDLGTTPRSAMFQLSKINKIIQNKEQTKGFWDDLRISTSKPEQSYTAASLAARRRGLFLFFLGLQSGLSIYIYREG